MLLVFGLSSQSNCRSVRSGLQKQRAFDRLSGVRWKQPILATEASMPPAEYTVGRHFLFPMFCVTCYGWRL